MGKGFTLIEILLTLAILSVLLGLGLFATIEGYRGSVSRSEREVVMSLLERARSRAMANVGQSSWGLCFVAPNYILFKGTVCKEGSFSEATLASEGTVVEGLEGATFAQLSGNAASTTVTIKQNGRTEAIFITNEGALF